MVAVEVVTAQGASLVVEHVEVEHLVAPQLHLHVAGRDHLPEGGEPLLGERLGPDGMGGHAEMLSSDPQHGHAVDPVAGQATFVPPSGHMAGIYAAVEADPGVHRAPANWEVQWAEDVTVVIDDNTQAILNPDGIDCLRAFPGRGILAADESQPTITKRFA